MSIPGTPCRRRRPRCIPGERRTRRIGWWIVASLLGTLFAPALAAAPDRDGATIVLCTGHGLVTMRTTPPPAPGGKTGTGALSGCGPWCTACAGRHDDPEKPLPASAQPLRGSDLTRVPHRACAASYTAPRTHAAPPPARAPPA